MFQLRERSLELAYFNHQVISVVNKQHEVNWLLIDLGIENVPEGELNQILDRMLIGLNRLFKYKALQQVGLGYFRMLDIMKKGKLYHPIIRILLPTIKSYFQGKYYIKHEKWLLLWQRAVGIESGLIVKVKVLHGKEHKREDISEKLLNFREQEEAYVNQNNRIITPRRLIGYSKILKSISDQLINDNSYNQKLDKSCIKDPIANEAFFHMLDWHLGLREDESTHYK
ncbi:protein rep [Niallia oryzisoli]|uniref:protein rep n=1 Tax=Niallia oryzisoli TaxID=1737571 RepID=UPI0037357A8F